MGRPALTYGVTGFHSLDAPAPPAIARAAVAAAIHPVADAIGGRVLGVHWGGVRSFHDVAMATPAGARALLFNAAYPLVAFAEPLAGDGAAPRFRDDPALAAAFSALTGFEPLTADDLARPLTAEDLAALNAAERKQIAYWRPASVGALIFNYWD